MAEEVIIDLILREIAMLLIEEINEEMSDVGMDIMDSAMSAMSTIGANMWMLNSRRVNSFGEAYEGCISAMDEVKTLCQQSQSAGSGEVALEIAIFAMILWYLYEWKIEGVPPLVDLTTDDLERNAPITRSQRNYNQQSYKIINYWGGGMSGLGSSSASDDSSSGGGSSSTSGSGGGRNSQQGQKDALNRFNSVIQWIINFLLALLYAIFDALFGSGSK